MLVSSSSSPLSVAPSSWADVEYKGGLVTGCGEMIGCRNGTGGHRFPFTTSVSSLGSLMLFNPGSKGGSVSQGIRSPGNLNLPFGPLSSPLSLDLRGLYSYSSQCDFGVT